MIELKRGYIASEDWMRLQQQDHTGRPNLQCLALSFQLEFAFARPHDRDHWNLYGSDRLNIEKFQILQKM